MHLSMTLNLDASSEIIELIAIKHFEINLHNNYMIKQANCLSLLIYGVVLQNSCYCIEANEIYLLQICMA